ncbi:RES family NAD+ phosphorylase [Pedobacter ginsengisoli]|uniref:RES family NAD+ phosphorylase n=1 Tax=Pedobacter ginsengisoli TaxID=363852 RepID=UPI0012FE66BC|nr:RES family NAD+ phosphorylase [Pedobacter ginsengisoli]
MKKRIEALSTKKGNCNFCDSKGVIVITCAELNTEFEQLFDMYMPNPNAEKSLGHDKPVLIHEHLVEYWPRLFNAANLSTKDVLHLVNQIGRGWDNYSDEFFETPIEFGTLLDSAVGVGEDLQLQWDMFSDEIKTRNRFFIGEKIDTDRLESVFERLAIYYPADTYFYRARISDHQLPPSELGKPPQNHTTPGRANPIGIPYLYISESKETTLYETRVALHEGITVGKFVTTETINVVSLKNIADYGPFEILDRGFDLEEFILVRPYLMRLEHELSKPVRKLDVHLDYLPTQYLCEFIKSLGFDGVEYKSAMNSQGYNLAIFKDRKLECIESAYHRVTNLTYDWDPK